MKLINKQNPTSKTLSSIAKSLNKFPQGIEKRFHELGINGTEYKGKIWYTDKEIEKLKEYLKQSEKPKEYCYSIYDFKKDLNKDYGTISRCLNYLNIKGFTTLQNKTFYTTEDKLKLYDFVNSNSSYNIQQILAKDTFNKNYGVDNPMKVKRIVNKIHDSFNENLNLKLKEFENTNGVKLISTKELCEKFNKDKTTIPLVCRVLKINIVDIDNYYFIYDSDLQKLQDYFSTTEMNGISYKEKELVGFIKSLGIDFIENDRSIISPKELDIYIPSKKLAIEFDGLYYHSELFLDKNYHLDKTNLCNEKEIDLIHVFEDDWEYRKEIVKSMIKSRLGIYERKIFARKCTVKKISNDVAKLFFDENHLQGYTKTSDVHIGLFYNDELVQAISITNKGWHDGNVELTRMVSKKNIQVIGGFSKLIKYYCKNYNCNNLISYVFKAWFNGKGYMSSGFEVVKENKPNYFYIMNNVKLHKSNFRKDKLKRMYENGKIKIYSDEMTESEICKSNNIYKIYDCGTIKVKYEFLT